MVSLSCATISITTERRLIGVAAMRRLPLDRKPLQRDSVRRCLLVLSVAHSLTGLSRAKDGCADTQAVVAIVIIAAITKAAHGKVARRVA
jgi:hypothetical protein